MQKIFVEHFGLIVDGKKCERVSYCTSYTDNEVILFITEAEMNQYITDNQLEVINERQEAIHNDYRGKE